MASHSNPTNDDLMQIHLKALDASGQLYFELNETVDPYQLIEVSRERVSIAREKGQVFAEGAVPHFGSEMLKAAHEGRDEAVHRNACNAAMWAWLSSSIFDGLTEEEFIQSNLHFTFYADGPVKFDRIKVGAPRRRARG